MIALLVMTDGRRACIEQTIPSALAELRPWSAITEFWIHDDSGDAEYRRWLIDRFPDFTVFGPDAGRSGFGGAIRSAWAMLRQTTDARFVFHLEDDFTFNRPVVLDTMADTLDHEPHLVQLALRRQPWNAAEAAAGGIVEQHPGDYTERHLWHADVGRFSWLEHRRFFTTNPSLYRSDLLVENEWPEGDNSEGRFGIELLRRNPDARFAYWGAFDSGEAVRHIGDVRAGVGY